MKVRHFACPVEDSYLENKTVDHKVESSIRSGPVLAEFTIQLTVACYQAARVKEWV